MISTFLSKQFIFFLFIGGFSALVNFTSRIFYNQWMSFSTAIIFAYITGMITAFVLMKFYVFKKKENNNLYQSIGIFVFVNLIAIAQVWLVSMALALYLLPWLGITLFAAEIAHLGGIIVPAFTSYLGHKYGSFR